MRLRALPRALPLIFLAVAALAVACGSGQSDKADNTPEATGTDTASPTVDVNVPLVEYRSPDKGYSVSYPQGWEVTLTGGFADTFITRNSLGQVAAQLSVACFPTKEGWTEATLMTQDAKAASLSGGFQTTPAGDTELAGLPAKRRRYSLSPGGLTVEHVVVYQIRGKCGWRVGLNSYGKDTLNAYIPLFDRILATFRVD